jgi:Family of unknown function (DUF6298)
VIHGAVFCIQLPKSRSGEGWRADDYCFRRNSAGFFLSRPKSHFGAGAARRQHSLSAGAKSWLGFFRSRPKSDFGAGLLGDYPPLSRRAERQPQRHRRPRPRILWPAPLRPIRARPIAEWQRENAKKVFIALEVPKAQVDALLADPVRRPLISAIDFHNWSDRSDGSLFAIEGGLSLAPRSRASFSPGLRRVRRLLRVRRALRVSTAVFRPPQRSRVRRTGDTPVAVFLTGTAVAQPPRRRRQAGRSESALPSADAP